MDNLRFQIPPPVSNWRLVRKEQAQTRKQFLPKGPSHKSLPRTPVIPTVSSSRPFTSTPSTSSSSLKRPAYNQAKDSASVLKRSWTQRDSSDDSDVINLSDSDDYQSSKGPLKKVRPSTPTSKKRSWTQMDTSSDSDLINLSDNDSDDSDDSVQYVMSLLKHSTQINDTPVTSSKSRQWKKKSKGTRQMDLNISTDSNNKSKNKNYPRNDSNKKKNNNQFNNYNNRSHGRSSWKGPNSASKHHQSAPSIPSNGFIRVKGKSPQNFNSSTGSGGQNKKNKKKSYWKLKSKKSK